jgi:hypothetical protein
VNVSPVKHNDANSVNRSILKKSRHIGFGVFIVHSSMGVPDGDCNVHAGDHGEAAEGDHGEEQGLQPRHPLY